MPLLVAGDDPKNRIQYIPRIPRWAAKPLLRIPQQKMADTLPSLVGKRNVCHADTHWLQG